MNQSALSEFGGIARLYGQQHLQHLQQARVAVIGIGGVGSWTAEALARSGVGCIILMDLDDICLTNINRQIHALHSTIGHSKIQTMQQRLLDINPALQVITLDCFYTAANADKLWHHAPHVVIDAIDALSPKAHLIATCYRQKHPLITCGGAGGRTDPSCIEIADLSKTKGDPLLASLRYKLKKDYGMPLGENARKLKIPCVFSQERPVYPTDNVATACSTNSQHSGKMGCDTGFGSVTHITGCFGFFAAHAAIKLLLKQTSSPTHES